MVRYLRVGVVASVHGIKGEVKVYPTSAEPERMQTYGSVFLARENESEDAYRPCRIESVRGAGKLFIVKFEGVETPEEARLLCKKEIYVEREKGVPTGEGEYYIADLIGARVLDAESGKALGVLTDVLQTAANDVYVCKRPSGKDVLFPAVKECVTELSPEEGFIKVRLLPGLLDIYE